MRNHATLREPGATIVACEATKPAREATQAESDPTNLAYNTMQSASKATMEAFESTQRESDRRKWDSNAMKEAPKATEKWTEPRKIPPPQAKLLTLPGFFPPERLKVCPQANKSDAKPAECGGVPMSAQSRPKEIPSKPRNGFCDVETCESIPDRPEDQACKHLWQSHLSS